MQPHLSNVFAMRLRLARKAKGLSQERLGILAGIDESSASARMNQYERGKHVPDFLVASKIAEVLELPTAYFYVEDDLLAEIIQKSYKLSTEQKNKVLVFIKSLHQ
ncbi:helix-turn-helix domain-containing protein [Acinetobacter baumannii]|uniref:helix-turn-helix domain-containing protein n=2 Tax=Acinetobacter baumannii TaxID=470 RepID=UPI0002BB63C3|nr:helix-turn-helix transcriptional regulator [Acinetobacter baumannii]EHU3239231.1 helix-turn-helix transcriptional regulator [Acinetobacter baumannii]EJB8459991.1 helix-turn-helix transcriptional regulator [Acinetobacter baumannii]EJB8477750.1 helix-turn-helix transcriptional regulator [Acinetobacter baumannii]EJB8552514.1 helix-turn-helix transcriptional regulator [Acinetobacter baumannii]EJB8567311.1 helix-turn-helix transcriptional regulator [Acinetobacter baumannii]